MEILERKKIGHVGVDSGQLLITDPCYINSSWEKPPQKIMVDDDLVELEEDVFPYSYEGACDATESAWLGNQLSFGAGVAFRSGYGDGQYDVYATYYDDKDWGRRIVKIEIMMGMTDDQESIMSDGMGYQRIDAVKDGDV